ncbi:MAG: helix-turn-helix transcriptional regulator [Clostridiales bacterium]|jgi:transcriptional regulator with XRE-family HTH domain|nr:helix-turn-helix transcriptional regulator [Clostridiales bacterium]
MTKQQSTGVGARLREARRARNLTAVKLAEALGISMSYIGLLERGERTPSLSLAMKICKHLGVSFDYLMFGNFSDNSGGKTDITVSADEIKEFYPDEGWLSADKETAFGLAVGNAMKVYRFDDEALSFIYAAINYIAWRVETSKIE